MKKIRLTREEREIEAAAERGDYVPVKGKELSELKASLEAWKLERIKRKQDAFKKI